MEAKDAVKAAKRYVADLFEDERLINLGLEELERDEVNRSWNVTLGFSREWQRSLIGALASQAFQRDYRVVKVREADGEVMSVKRLEAAE